MSLLGDLVVVLVALLHLYFLILEMFLWDKPLGLKTFRQTAEQAATTKVLAANQGLYNGFIAAGLLYGVFLDPTGIHFKLFFLTCVVIAGLYGAITANKRILYIQAMPGLLGLVLVGVSV